MASCSSRVLCCPICCYTDLEKKVVVYDHFAVRCPLVHPLAVHPAQNTHTTPNNVGRENLISYVYNMWTYITNYQITNHATTPACQAYEMSDKHVHDRARG